MRLSASWSTPTMPVGPFVLRASEVEAFDQRSSVAVPISGTGRECGTSASSAPSEIAIVAPKRSAMPSICSQNSAPPERRLGAEDQDHVGAGQRCRPDADGGPHDRAVLISSRRTCGRTVAKSVNASGSISASASAPHASIMVRSAVEAASPASFQPVKAATSTGRLRFGSASQRTCSVPTASTLPATRTSVGWW